MSINWPEITAKLPSEKTAAAKAKRKELFNQMDPNGNGYLSLAEVDKGLRDTLQCDEVFDCKPAIIRAFNSAKDVAPSRTKHSDDFVTRREFRVLMVALRQYFELWQMFDEVDTGDDRRVDKDEFRKAMPLLESWGVQVPDPDATFKEIDTNGGGQILFGEFCKWALKHSLDLTDDDD
ncbi:Flagellar calcium-binding protein [Diplonema papillatum]|nr:Flagellar calcium-binding protein [Diplonema papillatum]